MIAQLLIGLLLMSIGFSHLFHVQLFLSQKVIGQLEVKTLKKYQKKISFPFIILGLLCIVMGYIEQLNIFSISIFITIYIVIALIPLTIIALTNKSYLNRFVP